MTNLDDLAHRLGEAAKRLNQVSDEMNIPIARIQDSLKKLNLGIEAWVGVGDLRLGYGKHANKWGILISDGPAIWHFSDAPRKFRIELMDKLPDLLIHMANEAALLTKKLEDAKVKATQFIEGIKNA